MKRAACTLSILAFLLWLLPVCSAAANYAYGPQPTDAETKRLKAFRPHAQGAVERWISVVPAIERPTENVHASPPKASQAQLQKIVRDVGSRADFELELPNPAATHSTIEQVVWYERGTVVIGAEVLYRRQSTTATSAPYWSAGQMQSSHEDPTWAASDAAMPLATRFWKYRFTKPGPGSSEYWALLMGQWQFYRYHRSVESWVGGRLPKAELAAEAASFKEVDHGGISPLLVLSIGFAFIFIWPAYATYKAARGYERKTGRRAQLGLPQRRGGAKGERAQQAAESEGTRQGAEDE